MSILAFYHLLKEKQSDIGGKRRGGSQRRGEERIDGEELPAVTL